METIQASFSHSLRENPMGDACKAMLLDFMVKIVEIELYITLLWKPEHVKELFMASYGKCQ